MIARETTQSMKILFVEDDLLVREDMAGFLRERYPSVLLARDGCEGLDLYLRERPDLVISDIRMPGMDGLEMVRRIRGVEKDAVIILTTAFSDEDTLLDSLHLGVSRFIRKPLAYDELLRAVETASERVAERRAIEEAMAQLAILSLGSTGLPDEAAFLAGLRQEISRADRYSTPLSLVVFSIDGSEAGGGDEALTADLAALARRHVRTVDFLAYRGSGCFLLAEPQTSLYGAMCTADKLRTTIEEHLFAGSRRTTCSFGVTSFLPGEAVESLLTRAENAKARAAATGPGKIAAWSGLDHLCLEDCLPETPLAPDRP